MKIPALLFCFLYSFSAFSLTQEEASKCEEGTTAAQELETLKLIEQLNPAGSFKSSNQDTLHIFISDKETQIMENSTDCESYIINSLVFLRETAAEVSKIQKSIDDLYIKLRD